MASVNAKNALSQKATSNQVQKSDGNKGMKQMLAKMASEIKAALPEMMSSERFQRVALTAFNSNPKLQQCDPVSFIAAMMESAQLGLEPNTPLGQAYLIPYGNKVQFQVGYKGLLDLAQRSNKIKTIYAHAVMKNDEFDIDYGLEQKLIHKPLLSGDRGDVIGYYAVYHLTNGGYSFYFMTKDEVTAHARKFSKTFGSGPWQTDFDSMAKKTVIKQLLKYAPLSIEMQRAVSSDEGVKSKISDDMSMIENDIDSISADYTVIDAETGEVTQAEEVNFEGTPFEEK
ncbi:MAG: recombination protein RecT [Peptoclostridium sp.]|uniref:recombination protein RecT n=1 Tax=Peptoclostridium sp. TaxID=1904860 RepID=UPI00139D3F3D|nr:recombination protein RecT [Peptoclostridium sp.]MZQ75229.1 recombination protein RecT [Peptoclostridium sp.]